MISAIILTRNEERNIKDCLASLSWCDEIIIIDDNSTDRTIEIAKKSKAKIYIRDLNNNFSDQRNFGLTKAKGEWVLFVDADERVTSPLWYEIMQHSNQSISNEIGFFIKRQDFMWGRKLKYGETGNVKFIRLAKKGAGKWEGAVHEKWKVNGNLTTLKNPLLHYPHSNIVNFLHEINNYTDIRAKELLNKKVKVYWPTILIYPVAKFIINYIFKSGFRDSVPGLVFAMIMSFHSFLVRGKLWQLWNKK